MVPFSLTFPQIQLKKWYTVFKDHITLGDCEQIFFSPSFRAPSDQSLKYPASRR
jgi:hypothetical protein